MERWSLVVKSKEKIMNRANKTSKKFDDFDEKFRRAQKWYLFTWCFFATLGLGLIGFIIWVIVRIMQYFGIV